ncbi:GNAT family N-acetyltransferase [Rhizobium lentis]|uniref:GNAT family N-acetyltransferase n=1 Tax=Rhizobium lentis TaxID=1138194 RepID=A0ABS7IBT1_9HYPH|nr:GNAT family protein [Rhizobium lentis]MBX5089347.1 GNAT family N-acetyltransferase [Rhizobium lentis]
MIFLRGEDEIVSAYVSGQTGDRYSDVLRTLGILNHEGRIIGGFVVTNYTGFGAELSIAGRGCVARDAWKALGDIVFGELGCQRLSVTTRRSNKRVRKMAPKFKFKFEGIARRFYGDEDGIVFSLLRDEAILHKYWKDS